MLISIDPGLTGAISFFEDNILQYTIDMPVKKVVIKEATYKFKHKDKNKVYKTGERKGERPTVIRTKAKTKTVLDIDKIKSIFNDAFDDAVTVIEKQSYRKFQSGVETTLVNYGILLGIAHTHSRRVVEVSPQKWKSAMKLTSDKADSISLAEDYFNIEFKTHDQAESALIGLWWIDNV